MVRPLMTDVVFPTPPFWFATAMIFPISYHVPLFLWDHVLLSHHFLFYLEGFSL